MDHQLAALLPGELLECILNCATDVHDRLAVQCQGEEILRCGWSMCALIAGSQKLRHPAPLCGVQVRAQFQRCLIACQQPLDGLAGHAAVSQRCHVAVAQLAAVGMAGLAGDVGVGID